MIEIRYKFKDKEIATIKKNLVVLIDTREQRNEHIKEFFEKKNINFKIHKLDYGDYSIMIPKNAIEGLERDIYFDRDIVIERKANIDELANNLKKDGVRIKTELAHINKYNIRCYLLIEDPNYDYNIRNGNYRSNYKPKNLYGNIKKSIEMRYNTFVRPISKSMIGSEIYNTLESFVYERLKHEGWIEGDDYIGE